MDTYLLFFENINKFIEINFFYSLLFFSLYIFFYSAFSLPGLIIFIVFVGYSLGVFWGFLISIIFSTLGSFCFFIISKHILNKFFFKIFSKYTNKIDFYIKKSTFEYLVIFRIIPGPPLMLQNFFFSTLKISNYKFIFSTLIGFFPLMLFCVLLGNKINDLKVITNITFIEVFTWDLILIIFIFFIILFVRILFKNKSV